MRIVCGGLVALLVSCTTANTNKACSAGSCNDPAFPYCDVEGTISGEAGTCIAVTCTPGAIETCLGDDALTCNATGNAYEHVACDLGCKTDPEPHCGYIEPRYVPTVCDTAAAADLVVDNSAMLDPNLDLNCNGGLIVQPGAPPICVMHFRDIVVGATGTLKITGKSEAGEAETVGRPVALVADNDVTIDGIFDVSGDGYINGPGGGLVISGGRAELVSGTFHKGGGGAGGKTSGAAGGSTLNDGDGGSGGLATADPALLAVLMGGAAANRGITGPVNTGGGGGGGGVTLISCRGRLSVTGTIDAGGGGGSGGNVLFGADVPAWGGGAGGYVVLQGKRISVTGQAFANGGGGGTGTQVNLTPGENGSDGLRSANTPAAGHPGMNGGGRGGSGGVAALLPTVGGKPTITDASEGGGGGSVGFLQTYTPEGIEPTLTPSAVSPAFQPNATLKTR